MYWQSEKHGLRLMLGDCRPLLATVATVHRPGIVITDPPYGIGLTEHGRNGYDWQIAGDENQDAGQYVLDWCADSSLPTVAFASPMKPWRGKWRQHLVWDKGPAVGGGGDPQTLFKMDHELIQFARTGPLGGKRDSSVLRFWIGQRDLHLHPCQKPQVLMAYLLSKFAVGGQTVFDPFAGSGSTAVACYHVGIPFVGIEIDERYAEVAAKRLDGEISQGKLFWPEPEAEIQRTFNG